MMDNSTLTAILGLFGNAKALLNTALTTKRNGLSAGLQVQNMSLDVLGAVRLMLASGVIARFLPRLLTLMRRGALRGATILAILAIVRQLIRRRAYARSLALARSPQMDRISDDYVEGRASLFDQERLQVARTAFEYYDQRRSAVVIRRSLVDYQDTLVAQLRERTPELEDFAYMSLPTLGDFRSLDPGSLRSLLLRLLHGYHDKHKDLAPLRDAHRAVIMQYTGDVFVPLADRFSPEPTVSSGCRVLLCDLHLWVSRRGAAIANQLFAATVGFVGALQAV